MGGSKYPVFFQSYLLYHAHDAPVDFRSFGEYKWGVNIVRTLFDLNPAQGFYVARFPAFTQGVAI